MTITLSRGRAAVAGALLALALAAPAALPRGTAPDPVPSSGAAQERTAQAPDRAAWGQPFTRTELYFGRGRPDGRTVSDAEWQRFLETEVTPRFPDGFTVLHGTGQFRHPDGAIRRESTIVLVLLHPPESEDDSRVEDVRQAYVRTFGQHSVLRVDGATRVAF